MHPGREQEKVNTPNVIIKKPVLAPEKVAVTDEGELVALTIGNVTLRIHYADALEISQWIRMAAKRAKATAGDATRNWALAANLSDAAKIANGG